jgi:hypothetical protein
MQLSAGVNACSCAPAIGENAQQAETKSEGAMRQCPLEDDIM